MTEKKQKIVILGATGLIGSYLTDHFALNSSHKIYAIKNKKNFSKQYNNVTYSSCSISDKGSFKNLPDTADVVIMLAGLLPAGMSDYNPEKYFETNTIGMLNVLEYCRKAKVKQIIYTQTHSDVKGVWGKKTISPYEKPNIDYNNDHTIYVISKNAAVDLIKHYNKAYNLNYAIFRCPNIYAWHPDEYYFLDGKKTIIAYRYFIKRALASLPIEIYGDGKSKRDVVYIKDLIQMIDKAISKEIKNSIYNVSNGIAISIEEQIKDIISVFSPKDKPSEVIYRPEIEVVGLNYHYDISNAIEELEYKPQYFHIEMLEDMKKEMQYNRLNFTSQYEKE